MHRYIFMFFFLANLAAVNAQQLDSIPKDIQTISPILKINQKLDVIPQIKTKKIEKVKYLTRGGCSTLSFSQASLNNWAAGGSNALSATGVLNLFAKYRKKNVAWDNNLDIAYGVLKSGSQKLHKSDDKIEFSSSLGYKAIKKIYYSALLNYRSQFAKGYNYPNDSVVVSRFNAPAIISLSTGFDYKPNNFFSLYFSLMAGRLTIVSDQALADKGAFGVEPARYDTAGNKIRNGQRCRLEFGATLNSKYQKNIFKNVNVLSNLSLFNSYTDENLDNRKNIDVNWEAMINIKTGKYFTTSIRTNLIYDQNVIAKIQFKEMLGIGVSYKFN